jgi:hypothetical protein
MLSPLPYVECKKQLRHPAQHSAPPDGRKSSFGTFLTLLVHFLIIVGGLIIFGLFCVCFGKYKEEKALEEATTEIVPVNVNQHEDKGVV